MNSFKPAGYTSLSPYFIVNGAQQFIHLLEKVFNAQPLRRFDRPDGSVMHAEMRIDDSVIMLADSTQQYPPVPLVIHLYVADADKTYNAAIAAGCQSIEPPTQKEGDPDRRGTFTDFAGNMWSVSTQQ